jgi:nucleotide-binding universal stress UspA family protein
MAPARADTDAVRTGSDPAASVGATQDDGGRELIVVGVDGSPASKAALRWAARQARLTGGRLLAVLTWEFPRSMGWAPPWPSDFDPARDAKELLEVTVEEVLGPHPDVEVSTATAEGHPSVVLTELSKKATLVVVGCRGHGEFVGMLLGSVSEFLTTHAECPVAVVRHH